MGKTHTTYDLRAHNRLLLQKPVDLKNF